MTKKKRLRKENNLWQKTYDKVQMEVQEAMNDLLLYGACVLGHGSQRKFFIYNGITKKQEELFLDGDKAIDFINKLNQEKENYISKLK